MGERSPMIVWLLLAATLCVDAVALGLCRMASDGEYVFALYYGLAFGQISVACVWAAFAGARYRAAWLLPYLIASLACSVVPFVESEFTPRLQIMLGLGLLFWIHVSVLAACLWLMKQTPIVPHADDNASHIAWQMSLRHLLIVTTVVAILVATAARTIHVLEILALLPWIANNVTIAVIPVVLRRFEVYSSERVVWSMGSVAAAWMALSLVMALTLRQAAPYGLVLVASFIQAIVVLSWIELGPLIPNSPNSLTMVADDTLQTAPDQSAR